MYVWVCVYVWVYVWVCVCLCIIRIDNYRFLAAYKDIALSNFYLEIFSATSMQYIL